MHTQKVHYSHQQSPSATPCQSSSPSQKTQLILKQNIRTATSTTENPLCYKKKSKTTTNTEMELKKQLQIQIQQSKELALKYELSIQEIQKYQMIIERNNQKRNHEKQQFQQEITLLKKQIEQRSKSQIDLHENGILGHIVNEINHKAILHELQEYKEKCKQLTTELDTKNLQLDYLTKKLINTPSCQDLMNQVQELTRKVNEKDIKIKQYEEQLEKQGNKSKFLFRGAEYFNKKMFDHDLFSSSSNVQSTVLFMVSLDVKLKRELFSSSLKLYKVMTFFLNSFQYYHYESNTAHSNCPVEQHSMAISLEHTEEELTVNATPNTKGEKMEEYPTLLDIANELEQYRFFQVMGMDTQDRQMKRLAVASIISILTIALCCGCSQIVQAYSKSCKQKLPAPKNQYRRPDPYADSL